MLMKESHLLISAKALRNLDYLDTGLGADLVIIELHLLGRALGVYSSLCFFRCENRASVFSKGSSSPRLQTWDGALQGVPKGAAVIRFTGAYTGGHYQFVSAVHTFRINLNSLQEKRIETHFCVIEKGNSTTSKRCTIQKEFKNSKAERP